MRPTLVEQLAELERARERFAESLVKDIPAVKRLVAVAYNRGYRSARSTERAESLSAREYRYWLERPGDC